MHRKWVGRSLAIGLLGAVGVTLFTAVIAAESKPPAPLYLNGSAAAERWERYPDWNKARWDSYNTLARRDITPPSAPPKEIKGEITGDPENGRRLAFARNRGGGCLACHVMGPTTPEVPGNVGPDLSEIGAAGRPDEYLFNYVNDPRSANPESVMPPWGAHGFYNEAEIRDIVAFLKTLKTPASFKDPLDDPEKRPKPVEDRPALDPFVNPAVDRIDAGEQLTREAGPAGASCVSCHADPKAMFTGWAATMPKWEPRVNKVLGIEEFIYRHAKATTGAEYRMQSPANTDLAVYLHALSNGKPIAVDVASPPAKAALERGKTLYITKIGQLNFACADCHTPEKGANKWLRGQYLGEARGQYDHFPNFRTSRSEIWDIRKRLQWCNIQVRANELPPDAPEYGELELYLASLSQGLTLTTPNIRH